MDPETVGMIKPPFPEGKGGFEAMEWITPRVCGAEPYP